jgi:adenosylhomocysteine nucleosidase
MTLLIFPLKLEMDLFIKHLTATTGLDGAGERRQIQQFSIYRNQPLGLLCTFSGQGKVQMALSIQALCLALPEIQSIICGGTAGALSKDLKVGDIVVGESTFEHDFKVRSRHIPPPNFPADPQLLLKWRALNTLPLIFGKIASGDEDVLSAERRAELHGESQALCVAWEGAGGARASRFLKKPYIEVRVVTDLGTDAKSEFEAHVDLAMKEFAQAMERFLRA